MSRIASSRAKPSLQFWILAGFLVFVFLLGGGGRSDIQSLAILRPVSVLVCGVALYTLSRETVRENASLFWFFGGCFSLVALHLIPLPPSIWGALPGRQPLVAVDVAVGLRHLWRPLSMVPSDTWNALYSLFTPLAVLLLGVQLPREDRFRLLYVLIAFGLATGLIGLLQVVGPPDSALYLYKVTNNGSAVGLFANRNHQAVYLACLFPMLSLYAFSGVRTAEQQTIRLWSAVSLIIILIPLMLVTGSRAGLLLTILGLASLRPLYRAPQLDRPAKRKGSNRRFAYLVAAFGIVGLSLLTVLFSRAQAFERLLAADRASDIRLSVWGPIARLAWQYFPFGSGVGTFATVYQIDEPTALLSALYLNHAHNDWLEILMTAGLPGALLAATALFWWASRCLSAWLPGGKRGREVDFARLGSFILLMLGLASISDYPARIPSIMCLVVIAGLWLNTPYLKTETIANRYGSPPKTPLAA